MCTGSASAAEKAPRTQTGRASRPSCCCLVLIYTLVSQQDAGRQVDGHTDGRIPLTRRPRGASPSAWCSRSARRRCSCCRCPRQSSEAHLGWAWEETCTHIFMRFRPACACVCVCERHERSPGAILFQEGVFAVERSAVELQSGEAPVVQRHRLVCCGHVFPWEEEHTQKAFSSCSVLFHLWLCVLLGA